MSEEIAIRLDDISPQAWDDFVAEAPDGHILQSWAWGQFKGSFGWRARRVALERGGHIVAAAQVLLRKSPLGPLAYVPKGPVVARLSAELFPALISAVQDVARQERAFLLKIEPDWPDGADATHWLTERGFQASRQPIQPRRTILVDLTRDEETMLAEMKSKTRYNIRLAERKGVSVREGGAEELGVFHQLMEVTGERDRFGTHSRAYYAEVWRHFAPSGRARLFLAEYEGIVLAGVLALAFGGKAWNMYSASGNEHRNLMPNYLLQWEAMRWAKAKGCRTYDLWGIPDLDVEVLEAALKENRAPSSPPPPLWSLYQFKRGFGGEVVRYVGAYDFPYRPLAYRMLTWLWSRRGILG